jgi:DNA-binding transcriptional LysR family regulator
VAIQFAEQIEDHSLIGRKLAVNRRVICASPAYIARFGEVREPNDLARHNILRLSTVTRWNDWVAELCGGEYHASTHSNFEANSSDALYHAALAGLGIARLPTYLIADDIAKGRLLNLLPAFEDTSSNIYAVYLMRRNMSPKVRVFLDFLSAKFSIAPPWGLAA